MTMPMLRFKAFSISWCGAAMCASLVSACSSGGGSGAGGSAGQNPPSLCSTDARASVYTSNMLVKGTAGTFDVKLDSVAPWPLVKGENTLTVTVVDAAGAPLTDAMLTLKPFMPDHGHGSSIIPLVGPAKADGSIEIDHVNTFMPGIWQLTFTVTRAGQSDSSVITFCVPD